MAVNWSRSYWSSELRIVEAKLLSWAINWGEDWENMIQDKLDKENEKCYKVKINIFWKLRECKRDFKISC